MPVVLNANIDKIGLIRMSNMDGRKLQTGVEE